MTLYCIIYIVLCVGLLVLKELGIEIDLYVASEIDLDAVKVSE